MTAITVIGLGNVLTGDDAFGPYALNTLAAQYDEPDGVSFCDLGTPGLDLVPHIAGADALIVLDTVKMKAPAGTVRCYRKEDLVARGPTPRTNPHQPTLADTLLLLELQGLAPSEILLVGVAPERYDTGAPLSAAVRAAVAPAIALAIAELERLGATMHLRDEAAPADIWWEAVASTRAAAAG
ncbi:MAG TPA: hydrogenase maturation protease [Longimicrobiales bacterium]|nr:hydrogenase maturation protease [Longimicrobiales bacterium]